jgi:hypothetical protein
MLQPVLLLQPGIQTLLPHLSCTDGSQELDCVCKLGTGVGSSNAVFHAAMSMLLRMVVSVFVNSCRLQVFLLSTDLWALQGTLKGSSAMTGSQFTDLAA